MLKSRLLDQAETIHEELFRRCEKQWDALSEDGLMLIAMKIAETHQKGNPYNGFLVDLLGYDFVNICTLLAKSGDVMRGVDELSDSDPG